MLQLKTKPYLSNEALKAKLAGHKDVRIFQYWQIVYSVQINFGKKAEDIAGILGVEKAKVYRTVQLYNKYGVDFVDYLQWGGRRQATSYLSREEEKALLDQIAGKAAKGKILTAKDIRKTVEQRVGHAVSDDYLWDLFNRNKWSKKAPRPKHPKQDLQAQEEFKKNTRGYWGPAS
jgi:transposase